MKKLFILFCFCLVTILSFGQHGNFTDLRLINGDSVLAGTLNGTVYYDRVLNKFRFRQNGSWNILGQSAAGLNQEVQTSNGSGVFTASGLYASQGGGTTFLNTAVGNNILSISTEQVNMAGTLTLGFPISFSYPGDYNGATLVAGKNNGLTAANIPYYPLMAAITRNSGTVGPGFGVGMSYSAQNTSNIDKIIGTTSYVLSNTTNTTESADFILSNISAGTLAEKFRIRDDGSIITHDNSVSSFHTLFDIKNNTNASTFTIRNYDPGAVYSGTGVGIGIGNTPSGITLLSNATTISNGGQTLAFVNAASGNTGMGNFLFASNGTTGINNDAGMVQISGKVTDFASGTLTAFGLQLIPELNYNVAGTHIWRAIDYNPTLTSVTGLAKHYGVTIGAGTNGFGTRTPTAIVHIGTANSTAAGSGQIKLTMGGTLMTTPETGAFETDASHLYFSIGSTRYQLDQQTGSPAWLLASGGTLTGANTITSNAKNQLLFGGTWTATAAADAHIAFGGTFTAASSLGVTGYLFNPSLIATGTGSTQIGLDVAPTFSGGSSPNNISARFLNGTVLIGNGTPSGESLYIANNQNASTTQRIINTTSGNLATTGIILSSSGTSVQIFQMSPGFSSSGIFQSSSTALLSTGAFNIGNNSASPITFWTNSVERIRVSSVGEIGLAGANYGTTGQVITSSGPGVAVVWSTLPAWLLTGTSTFTGPVTIDQTATSGNTLTFLTPNLGVTSIDGKGLWIKNATTAAAGAQQISGGLLWEGQGWATTPVASQSVKFMADVLPIQGAANPTGAWRLRSSVNGGAYVETARFLSTGEFSLKDILYWDNSKLFVGGTSAFVTSVDLTYNGGFPGLEINIGGARAAYLLHSTNTTLTSTTQLILQGTSTKIVNNLGIGITPVSTLDVSGSFGAQLSSTSTDITLDATYYTVLVSASGANRTITLPASSGCTRRIYRIKKTDATANTVTIDGNASETIDGALTKVVNTQYSGYAIQSDGSNWSVIATF